MCAHPVRNTFGVYAPLYKCSLTLLERCVIFFAIEQLNGSSANEPPLWTLFLCCRAFPDDPLATSLEVH